MKMLKKANHLLEYTFWFVILLILAFSVYNDGGINILSHLLISASLFLFGLIYLIKNPQIKIGRENIFLVLFLLFFLLSYAFSQTKNVGLFELILFVSSTYIYIFISIQKWDTEIFKKFLFGILLVGLFITLYGFYPYILEPFNRFSSTFGISIYKFVSYPNAFANFIIAIIPIPFYFLHLKNNNKNRAFFIITIIIFLTALFLTYSRGAYITLLIVTIFCLFLYSLNKRKPSALIKKIVLVSLLVFVSGILMFSINQIRQVYNPQIISFTEKISFEADEKNISATNRLDFWKGSVQIFADNPFFGTGPGSFEYVFPAYQKSLLGNSNSPHNLFLKILSENGLFSAFFMFLFLTVLFIQIIKVHKKISKNDKLLLYPLLAGVGGILLHNMVDYNLNFVSNILLLFVFLGMVGFIKNKYSNKTNNKTGKNIFKAIFLVVGSAMLFIAFHEAYYSHIFKQARSLHKKAQYESAIIKYKKAQNIFLKRGYYIVYAQLYHEKYEEEGNIKDLNKSEKLLLSGLEINKRDAFLLNYLGDIYYEMGEDKKAANYYIKALELDPKNNLDYHYDVLKTDDDLDNLKIKFILDLLEDYKIKLSQNAHLTVLTGNYDSAIEIYKFLLEQIDNERLDSVYKDIILKEKREIELTYLEEKEKFEQYYDIELKKEN